MLQNKHLVAKIGFDPDENIPSKVSVTGIPLIPVYLQRYTGTPVRPPILLLKIILGVEPGVDEYVAGILAAERLQPLAELLLTISPHAAPGDSCPA